MNEQIKNYRGLSISERIQLVEDIWDSIATDAVAPQTLQLSENEKAEMRRRVEAHEADPSTAIPWAQVRKKLFQNNT